MQIDLVKLEIAIIHTSNFDRKFNLFFLIKPLASFMINSEEQITILSLPSELFIAIFEVVGFQNKHYNARERANDLFNFSLVSNLSWLHSLSSFCC